MRILAIETSADETSIALIETCETSDSIEFTVHGFGIASQIELHNQYGGIFPAMAKREHQKNLPIVFANVLEQASISESALGLDYICVTSGPGLEPTLWTGIVFAQELSKQFGVPVIPVNHMEGHILSVLAPDLVTSRTFTVQKNRIIFPALALLISGGHTELVVIQEIGDYKIIGKTRDDAVGEAFDKVARILGLPYPGGPEISRLAKIARDTNVIKRAEFPRPMIHSKDYDFSFSGLKTAVLYFVKAQTENPSIMNQVLKLSDEAKADIAREFENAVAETLVTKTKQAIEEFNIKTLIIGGGVSANTFIRSELQSMLDHNFPETNLMAPNRELTGDNALMIALAGYFKIQKNPNADYGEIRADGNWSL